MIRLWGATALVLLVLDAAWLTAMADGFYRARIGHLLRPGFDVAAAGVFYVLYVTGIVVLAQRGAGSWREAAWRGAVLGLVAYGTYDLTNQATLRDWPVVVTVVDLAWGTVLTGVAAGLGWWIGRKEARSFS